MDDNVSIKAFVAALDRSGMQDKPTRLWLADYGDAGEGQRRRPGEDRLSIAYDHDHVLDDLAVICQVSGVDPWRIADALEAALRASDNPAAQAGAFRKRLPWSEIVSGARNFAGA